MSKKKQEKISEILLSLAEYRCLSVEQLAALHFSSLQMARKARNELDRAGFVDTIHGGYGGGKGRPGILLSLSRSGIERLIMEDRLRGSVKPGALSCPGRNLINHQLLLNWVCIHVRRLQDFYADLKSHFVFANSHLLNSPSGSTLDIKETFQTGYRRMTTISFIPDGVFSIGSTTLKRTLLFFVEVDMGSETNASEKDDPNDFLEKTRNYRAYFLSKAYKRYEHWRRCKFNGFRVLVVTNTHARMEALCRLVNTSQASDFIWLTSKPLLLNQGISDNIWARGGSIGSPPSSILGLSMNRPSPILPIKA